MSHIGKNIKRIRTVRKLSQADFAKLFNLARPSVGAYEEGRSEPKIQTLLDIAQKFGLSVDLLLTKELTVNDLYKLDLVNEKFDQVHGVRTTHIPAPGANVVGLVRSVRYPEYIANHQKRDFLNGLSPVNLPLNFKGEARAFEMYGREMDYNHAGIHHGDILLCKRVPEVTSSQLVAGHIYVLITKDQVIIRRLKKLDANKMSMAPDDPHYDDMEISIDDNILEAWEVKGVYSTFLNPPKLVDEKVMLLERTVTELAERITRLENPK